MKRFFIGLLALTMAFACHRPASGNFSADEISLIRQADSIMKVLTIEDSLDLAVLRAVSTDMSAEALLSDDFSRLSELMVATVTHPSQDGVGIAGPQVGLNRRVVAVQRFDKEPVMNASGKLDHPFEVYPNIRIVCLSDSTAYGAEGCLSVPDMRADVLRSTEVVIEYADLNSAGGDIPMILDTISGFTAVIFQHEIDHLEGILYIDRL